ncbi:hypothetical protein BaRGS_00018433 [Batillaria attramentaria]|uniref:Uncharacterized protein n=1 Tax=Batillaria attramentaria TaxID=370345 RepID=A0ABD0KU05_9CAEN
MPVTGPPTAVETVLDTLIHRRRRTFDFRVETEHGSEPRRPPWGNTLERGGKSHRHRLDGTEKEPSSTRRKQAKDSIVPTRRQNWTHHKSKRQTQRGH